MDRIIVYPGQIPTDAMILNGEKNAMIGIAKLAAAALGINGVVHGLAVAPTSPVSLNVNAAPGQIYALANVDTSAYGSIVADTTHQVLKQGLMMDQAQLSCPAPVTAGQSINYLVQAAFSEADTGATPLPYYNSSNPSQAWTGPNNSGTAQATLRQDLCVVTVKAGVSAATGSQVTPTPDTGNIGLYVVTVANGQATITAANIAQYSGASFVPQDGLASNVAHAIYFKSVAGSSDVTLTAQEAAYPILVLTGALTGNINLIVPASSRQRIISNTTSGAFQITAKTAAGTGVVAPQGYAINTYCDGTSVFRADSSALSLLGGSMLGTLNAKVITETKTAPAIAAGALALDLSACSVFDVALNGAITALTLSNPPPSGTAIGFTLIFTADGTARSVTWPASVKWAGGTAPTLTSTATKKDFFSFYTADGGATYQAFVAGQNI